MIVSRLAGISGLVLGPDGVGNLTRLILLSESTKYNGWSLPPPRRMGTTTMLFGSAADDGSFCAGLGEGVPLGEAVPLEEAALELGLPAGVGVGLALLDEDPGDEFDSVGKMT